MKTPYKSILAIAALLTIAPGSRAEARDPLFYRVVDEDGVPPAGEVYRRIIANLRSAPPDFAFSFEAADVSESYERIPARPIYYNLETNAHLELLNRADLNHPLDVGFADAAARRNERIKNLAAWSLWLLSREGPSYAGNYPESDGGPWKSRGLRGWGSRDFNNGTSDFRGWHTYAEQTGPPLIGILEAVIAIRNYLADEPGMAARRLFDPDEAAAVAKSGRMRIEAIDLETLTYAQTADFLVEASGRILDWWYANAMSVKGNLRYFWYTSSGDANFGKTGRPAREWFVAHSNQLMGRASFLYFLLTGEHRYRDLAVDLYAAFLAAHYPCRTLFEKAVCYHYALWGESLARRVAENFAWTLGAAYPDEVEASPKRNLEEPFHYNASHALAGLLHGRGLLNRRDLSGGAADLRAIQRAYPVLLSVSGKRGGCGYLTPLHCRRWPVAGPAKVRPRVGLWWVVGRDAIVPTEVLTWSGREIEIPDVSLRSESIAAYYLTEGASDETFELLLSWWDQKGRRAERDKAAAISNANFKKMGVFLAAAALERMQADAAAQSIGSSTTPERKKGAD